MHSQSDGENGARIFLFSFAACGRGALGAPPLSLSLRFESLARRGAAPPRHRFPAQHNFHSPLLSAKLAARRHRRRAGVDIDARVFFCNTCVQLLLDVTFCTFENVCAISVYSCAEALRLNRFQ